MEKGLESLSRRHARLVSRDRQTTLYQLLLTLRALPLHLSEYMLWTDDTSRRFIAEKYPSFLATFEGYEYPIQRADAIRYL